MEATMRKKYIVKLTNKERNELNKIQANGNVAVKKYKQTQVLLLADESTEGSDYSDAEIADEVEISIKTIARIRQKFAAGGVKKVFEKKFTPRYSRRRFDGEGEAHLVAMCCNAPPEGHARWTLRLLKDKIVECGFMEEVAHETIRRTLKKTNLNLGRKKNGVFRRKPMQNLFAKWKTC
jgi:transposase